jgi:hypothetical protein
MAGTSSDVARLASADMRLTHSNLWRNAMQRHRLELLHACVRGVTLTMASLFGWSTSLNSGTASSRGPDSTRSIPVRITSPVVSNPKKLESFWKLGGLTPLQLGRTVSDQINANNVFGRAAELAFYFLFALFPLIFFLMTLFGLFASHSVELQDNLLSYFADFLLLAAFFIGVCSIRNKFRERLTRDGRSFARRET